MAALVSSASRGLGQREAGVDPKHEHDRAVVLRHSDASDRPRYTRPQLLLLPAQSPLAKQLFANGYYSSTNALPFAGSFIRQGGGAR